MIHVLYPNLLLSRSKEDVCDACMRIDTQLLNPNILLELYEKSVLDKSIHIDVVIGKCKAISKFIQLFVEKVSLGQVLHTNILPKCIDNGFYSLEKVEVEIDLNDEPVLVVLVQVEDYRGSLALPHYGFNRPSTDYFNSNLILHQFVSYNISDGKKFVPSYDERDRDVRLTRV